MPKGQGPIHLFLRHMTIGRTSGKLKRLWKDGVLRKKDIYDKRPEDHPQYPEEWRIFWEKRYQEIQAEGKDADGYDYKPDWIPYWAKKVEDLYQNEIRTKVTDLMK